jgi:general secretion pathway protein M
MAMLKNLQLRWAALAAREQRAVRAAATLVGGAMVWSVLLSPALGVLTKAQAQHAVLDSALADMAQLQLRARALQARNVMTGKEALSALQSAAAVLGPAAQWTVIADQATLTLKQAPADLVAQWFALSAGQAGAPMVQPLEVHLQRDTLGAAAATPASVRWSGTLVYQLPP